VTDSSQFGERSHWESGASMSLPFSAVVGQEEAKLALLLAAIEPRLGGVLLRGHKGSAKTTLARGFARLLPGTAPFVELPLGASEDRVLGSLDLAELLANGTPRYRPGLLAAAHGGVLYVDEINLLADHLVDVLLDVAVSGVNRVEREGISHTHPARFVLVASMNPEEGELRPQLLDRFGLAVDIVAPTDAAMRVLAVQAQLAVERDPGVQVAYEEADAELRRRLASVGRAALPDEVVRRAADVALAVGAEGLRADLMLCRAAVANASWNGSQTATIDDLRTVAPIVLAHRRRRAPFEEPGIADDELDHAFASDPESSSPAAETRTEPNDPDRASGTPTLPKARAASNRDGRRDASSTPTGRYVRDVPAGDAPASIAAAPSAINVAARRAADPGAAPTRDDLREAVRERRTGNLVIVTVDTSGSMGAERRIELAKGVVLELLAHAYQQRDRVALVTFQGDHAEVVLRPTGSIEIARNRLVALPTGGATPLAAGLAAARTLARTARDQALEPVVVVITDGRATSGGDDPLAAARREAEGLARDGVRAVVVDAEHGAARLGLAREIAGALRCECVSLDTFDAQRVADFARSTRS
jgi:magnesium chelatase subunit D